MLYALLLSCFAIILLCYYPALLLSCFAIILDTCAVLIEK
jgi:hypothetical protein